MEARRWGDEPYQDFRRAIAALGAEEHVHHRRVLVRRDAEVDFGEVVVRLRGELVTCALFAFRMSFSGKAVHRVSISAGQEAFFEGQAHALRTLGGVPTGKVRYDDLKAAVARVLGLSRARVETER